MKSSRFAFLPVALIVALTLAIAGCGGDDNGTTTGGNEGATQSQSATQDTGSTDADGAKVFASAGCAGCHTLKAANATGKTGPNLDDTKPSEDLVMERVTNGKGGMPAFKGQLSEDEIHAVSVYVSENAGK